MEKQEYSKASFASLKMFSLLTRTPATRAASHRVLSLSIMYLTRRKVSVAPVQTNPTCRPA